MFDVLALPGSDLRDRPLVERRQALEHLIADLHPCLQLVLHTSDIAIAEEWLTLPPIEGVVAKRADGRYASGRRDWVKVKRQRTADCVVIGVTGDAARPSLVLGLRHPDGELHHLGVTRPLREDQIAALAPVLEAPVANEHPIRSRWQYDAVPAWRRVPPCWCAKWPTPRSTPGAGCVSQRGSCAGGPTEWRTTAAWISSNGSDRGR